MNAIISDHAHNSHAHSKMAYLEVADARDGRRSPASPIREEVASVYGKYFQEYTLQAE